VNIHVDKTSTLVTTRHRWHKAADNAAASASNLNLMTSVMNCPVYSMAASFSNEVLFLYGGVCMPCSNVGWMERT